MLALYHTVDSVCAQKARIVLAAAALGDLQATILELRGRPMLHRRSFLFGC